MTGEDIIDCLMGVDEILEEIESALQDKNYPLALHKLKEARSTIEDLREEDCETDTQEIEMKVMNELK